MRCSTFEGVVALIIGCAPAIKSFWSRYITKSTGPKTQATGYGYRRGTSTKTSENLRSSAWEGSNEHINRSQTDSYIRMDTY